MQLYERKRTRFFTDHLFVYYKCVMSGIDRLVIGSSVHLVYFISNNSMQFIRKISLFFKIFSNTKCLEIKEDKFYIKKNHSKVKIEDCKRLRVGGSH